MKATEYIFWERETFNTFNIISLLSFFQIQYQEKNIQIKQIMFSFKYGTFTLTGQEKKKTFQSEHITIITWLSKL